MVPKPSHRRIPPQALREQAEALLRAKPADTPTMPTEDVQALIHELNVHQMELEIQNEELRQAQAELSHARDRYADLYEFAPVGYVTLNKEGRILEANLTAATMLGVERQSLLRTKFSHFVARDSQDDFYLHGRAVFSSEAQQTCDVELHKANGTRLVARLESIAYEFDGQRRSRTAIVDVTLRQDAEVKLKQLNEELERRVAERTQEIRLLAEAISHLGEGVVITDDELDWPGPQIRFVNEAMCRITGYAASELIGKTPRVLQGSATDRETLGRLKTELSAGRACLVELTNYRKDGTPYDAELFVTPLFDAGGRRTNFVSVHRDVTERRRAEEALCREHELSEGIINSAEHIILLLDTEGRIVRFNGYLERLSGWTLPEVRGREWFDTFLPERDRVQIRELFRRALFDERTRGNVNSIVTKGGSEREIEWHDVPMTSADGQLIGLLCTGQDITDRKRAEESLRASEERMRAVLNTAADAIITIDRRGVIDNVNAATERLFGFTRDELVGQHIKILMPPPYCDEHDGYLARYFQTGEARMIGIGREMVARRKDGSTFPVDLAVSEVDHLGIFTGIVRDISDRKELQRQVLEIAAEEDRSIGHELHEGIQQEITAMELVAGTLRDALDGAEHREIEGTAARILAERDFLRSREIADKLCKGLAGAHAHVQQLSRGIMPVQVDAQGLNSALAELAASTELLQNLKCRFESPEVVEVADNTTATHLYRIAQEAVNNALRHSQGSEIRVSLVRQDGQLVLQVSDNGMGIDEAFSRRAGAPVGSTGIGLRAMHYRASLIGAMLDVRRREGGGTQVTCTVLRGGGG